MFSRYGFYCPRFFRIARGLCYRLLFPSGLGDFNLTTENPRLMHTDRCTRTANGATRCAEYRRSRRRRRKSRFPLFGCSSRTPRSTRPSTSPPAPWRKTAGLWVFQPVCVGVPAGLWVFQLVCGCSSRFVGVPAGLWVFQLVCGCSSGLWVFRPVCGCSNRFVGVPASLRVQDSRFFSTQKQKYRISSN